jgi:hypothetical protein
VKAVLVYGGATGILVFVLAAVVVALVRSAEPAAIRLAAGVAWAVQLVAFGALVAGRRGPHFLVTWLGGILLRFAVVAGVALWLTRSGAYDAPSALVGLVGFVFVLVLLEPLFLRLAD